MRMGQGVRTGLGHGGIICVLQTQFSSFNYCTHHKHVGRFLTKCIIMMHFRAVFDKGLYKQFQFRLLLADSTCGKCVRNTFRRRRHCCCC